MAGDWIPVTTDLHNRLEVLQIACETGRDRFEVCGLLCAFWGWVQNETEDGILPGVTVGILHSIIGADEPFWRSAVNAGWIVEADDGMTIPNFDRWISESAKKRLRDRGRKRGGNNAEFSRNICGNKMESSRNSDGNKTEKKGTTEQNRTEQNIKPGSGAFSKLASGNWVSEDLREDSRLLILSEQLSRGDPEGFPDCPDTRLRIFGAAVRALEIGKKPIALFISILNDRRWHVISAAQEDEANRRLKLMENGATTSRQVQDITQNLVNGIKANTDEQAD